MSRHNYSQYSNTKKSAPVVESCIDPVITMVEETPVIPEVTPEPAPKTVEGAVVGCTKLNVRIYPSLKADPVCVINVNDKVTIDPAKSNKDWFKVRTANGDEGYSMRKFVKVNR